LRRIFELIRKFPFDGISGKFKDSNNRMKLKCNEMEKNAAEHKCHANDEQKTHSSKHFKQQQETRQD
jgi:hypothetical protein